jgi:hypothetical protein
VVERGCFLVVVVVVVVAPRFWEAGFCSPLQSMKWVLYHWECCSKPLLCEVVFLMQCGLLLIGRFSGGVIRGA